MSFNDLVRQADNHRGFGKLEDYYDGEARLDALGVSLPPEVRVLEMIAPWPKMSVDVLAEVLRIDGFKHENAKYIKLLRKWWQANNLDSAAPLGFIEALVQGLAYIIVGPGRSGIPRITMHSRTGMAVAYDHMGDVSEAVRKYKIGDVDWAAHYLPGFTTYYKKSRNGQWVADREPVATNLSRVPVVPLVNKVRLKDDAGRSEMLEVMSLADAGSRSLTNLQVAQELLAMPQRYLFGAGLESLKDQNGDPISKLKAYMSYYVTGPEGGQAGQIPGADLSQIINTIKLYALMVSSVTGIPPSMLGISTDNPSSAEAMRAAKERLISKAEAKQALFGDALEEAMVIALELDGNDVTGLETLESVWRDPATPSLSAKSAHALQGHAQGVISAATARDFLQLTPAQKEREDERDTGFANVLNRAGL